MVRESPPGKYSLRLVYVYRPAHLRSDLSLVLASAYPPVDDHRRSMQRRLRSSSRFTLFIALNTQFFILSHQPDCAKRKLDQLSQHLSTLDVCTDRQQDLFMDFIHSWSDYVQLEYDYHTHAYEHIRHVCETKLFARYQQHELALDWHRLLYHRLHVLYRLTCFQQLRTNKKVAEKRKRSIWK